MSDLVWLKSSYSGVENSSCVEVAVADQAVAVRDSKNPAAGYFEVSRSAWRAFLVRTARVR
ncbi:DUF397 domain-containing protein [Amycolatopsis anabasis]|uniref:DUF397 domain-containing protein n=1 Tax=Amycolatopsis anabasis TaxID=1840409 RepID=UPI00131ABFA0|nr:DUF397 domain-containing protein [Amycolatopsis anabasis]